MFKLRRPKLMIATIVLGLAAGLLWWQWTPLKTWYCVRQLVHADEPNRETWAKRVAGLDTAALPSLLAHLSDADGRVCANVEAALVALVECWSPDDERGQTLAERLSDAFSQASPGGRQATLRVVTAVLRSGPGRAPARL